MFYLEFCYVFSIFYHCSTSRAGKVMISHFYQGITYRMQGYIGQI
ncbi:hypothetical protein HMPREF0105_3945 [Bacteroides sp. 3_1_33FAA]|uniref:Uncharacterized protein n=1 Tax=Phocaeicola dorei DSM 17855 TaxID=483217 RepID=B6W621_9BACT|nr:hypothetical protein BACDOR_05038 [Phocaeicola dorei DSM 17855]EEZ19857.1 hypothetical protein HMPREF0105_3945 [Bacteroides sp. 3_1_33FAA]